MPATLKVRRQAIGVEVRRGTYDDNSGRVGWPVDEGPESDASSR
jgi:hypothetical protein